MQQVEHLACRAGLGRNPHTEHDECGAGRRVFQEISRPDIVGRYRCRDGAAHAAERIEIKTLADVESAQARRSTRHAQASSQVLDDVRASAHGTCGGSEREAEVAGDG